MSEPAQPDHFPGALSAFVITVAAIFLAAFVITLFGLQPDIGALGVGEAIGLGLVGTLAARRVPPPQPERLGLRGFDPHLLGYLVLLLPIVILVSELDNVIRALVPLPLPPDTTEASEALEAAGAFPGSLSLYDKVQTAIVVVGIAPVVEEWLFRGVIQQGVVAQLGRFQGVLLAAALFAVVHTAPSLGGQTLLSPLLGSLVLGLVFGALRLASGSILAPILLSAGINAVGLIALAFDQELPIAGFNAPGSHTGFAVLAVSVTAVAFGLAPVLRGAREAPVVIPIPEPQEEREGGGGFDY